MLHFCKFFLCNAIEDLYKLKLLSPSIPTESPADWNSIIDAVNNPRSFTDEEVAELNKDMKSRATLARLFYTARRRACWKWRRSDCSAVSRVRT